MNRKLSSSLPETTDTPQPFFHSTSPSRGAWPPHHPETTPSDTINWLPEEAPPDSRLAFDSPMHSLLDLFEEMPFHRKVLRVLHGLRQPPDSGEHKWARLQILRLLSPLSGVTVPLFLLLLMAIWTFVPDAGEYNAIRVYPVDPQTIEPPKDAPEEPETKDVLPDPLEIPLPEIASLSAEEDPGPPDSIAGPMSQEPPVPGVVQIRCPVSFIGMPTRTGDDGDGIQKGLKKYNPIPGVTEGAVYRALRWLKNCQEPDGSWTGTSGGGKGRANVETAMTALALLTYLGHGETPASPEFGPTVEKAMKWLVHRQESGGFPRPYQHPIATYALAEAYSMTLIPSVGRALEQATDVIVAGQNPSGGFNYQLAPCERNDTSVMGWCAQALKAAKIAHVRNPGLDAAMKNAIAGFKNNYTSNGQSGGFGYTGPGMSGLTGVGTLCLQMLGDRDSPEVQASLRHLVASDKFSWQGATWKNVYYWYYNTQARFQQGGECWTSWRDQFAAPLVAAQIKLLKAGRTPSGRQVDIGYWDTGNSPGGRVMDTTLCALTLEVYYRYLPTYQKPEAFVAREDPRESGPGKDLSFQFD